MKIDFDTAVVVDGVRSVHNVGSFFRTADGVGVDRVYLTGITPTPTDRFGRDREDIKKTALGAEQTVSWEYHEGVVGLLGELKKAGVSIYALEQSNTSIDFKNLKPTKPFALVVGGEVEGISNEVLSLCDEVIEIPMRGEKESLNVSVALGIALYQLT